MLTFPKAQKRCGTALIAAVLMMLAVGMPLPAAADDLDHRKQRVERRIGRAGEDLDQSSASLVREARAVSAAASRLTQARTALSRMRGQLVAARANDAQTRQQLATADRALFDAAAEVDNERMRIAEHEDEFRQIALETYQVGDPSLMALSLVLTSRNPADLTG